MVEIEPIRTFTGKRYEIHFWEDEEEVTVSLKRNGGWITGIVGPLSERDYPELFSDKVTQIGTDQTARRIIREILSYTGELGFQEYWSENFPIQRLFPFREYKNLAIFLSDLLRSYLQPSGPDGNLQPGDITAAAQNCLRDLIDPNITVNFKLEPYRLPGHLGNIWKSGENTFDVVVREVEGEPFEKFYTEGHEAGHLIARFFRRDQDNSS